MALHELIYAPDGEPFEVKASAVPDLLLNKGWTRGKPTFDAPKTEAKPAKKPRRKAKADPKPEPEIEENQQYMFD